MVIVVQVLTEVPVLTSCQTGQCTVHSVLCVLSAYCWHGIDQQCLCCCPGADRSGGPSLYCLLQSSRSVYTPSMKLCSIVIHINFTHVNKAKQFELCYLHSVHNFISCHKHEGRVKNHFQKNQQNEKKMKILKVWAKAVRLIERKLTAISLTACFCYVLICVYWT